MSSKYKLAINAEIGFNLSMEESFDCVKRAGFDGVFTGWHGDISHYAKEIEKRGLEYQSVHAPFTSVQKLWAEGEEADNVRDMLCGCVNDCADAGVDLVIMHTFIGFEDHSPNQHGIDNFRIITETAAKRNVRIAYENVEGEEYLTAIMDALGDYDNVGFCWDTGHEMCYNRSQDAPALWCRNGKLFGTHFNDNLGISDKDGIITWLDDLHLLPFDGIADWKGIMDRIRREKFEGPLTFELTIGNKPGGHTHDGYAAMKPQDFYDECFARAYRISNM